MLLALILLASGPIDGLDAIYPQLDALYLDLHQAPELAMHEEKTSARLAAELKKLGYEVTTGVGGTGVVGVLKNGKGPTVLLRTELDALPVEEKTGLPFASKATGVNPAGQTVPVMHACGHDAHMAAWTGTAALLARQKSHWRGTVLMIGQPAEEIVAGSRAMLADGLFTRFPKPDFAIAVHDSSDKPAGKVYYVPEYGMAGVDSVDVTIFGRGGHGAKPNATVDPVVIAARTVLAWQTLVSREKDPLDPAVLSVGSIHGGTRYNIIPDEVKLQLTVRA
jgi:hippurate hydrolase